MSAPDPRPGAAGPDKPADASPQAPERRWVWMDRWDPGTWEMPSNPTKLQRVMAAIALVIVVVMTIWLPFKVLGVW